MDHLMKNFCQQDFFQWNFFHNQLFFRQWRFFNNWEFCPVQRYKSFSVAIFFPREENYGVCRRAGAPASQINFTVSDTRIAGGFDQSSATHVEMNSAGKKSGFPGSGPGLMRLCSLFSLPSGRSLFRTGETDSICCICANVRSTPVLLATLN